MTAEELLQKVVSKCDQLDRIEQKLDRLLDGQEKGEFVTIEDIAREVGRTRQWVHVNPWVLPGPPDIDGKPKRWLRSRWDQHKQSLSEHKRRWESMSLKERERILSV